MNKKIVLGICLVFLAFALFLFIQKDIHEPNVNQSNVQSEQLDEKALQPYRSSMELAISDIDFETPSIKNDKSNTVFTFFTQDKKYSLSLWVSIETKELVGVSLSTIELLSEDDRDINDTWMKLMNTEGLLDVNGLDKPRVKKIINQDFIESNIELSKNLKFKSTYNPLKDEGKVLTSYTLFKNI